MSDFAGDANKAPTAASGTAHTQERPSFAKPHNRRLCKSALSCVCEVVLAVAGVESYLHSQQTRPLVMYRHR